MPRRSWVIVTSIVAAACGKSGAPAASPQQPAAPVVMTAGTAADRAASAAKGAPGVADRAPSTAGTPPGAAGSPPDRAPATGDGSPAAGLPPHARYATLAEALGATLPEGARVLGFGELHARVDRAQARSALAAFTEALPAIGARISDLVVETWIVDPRCGQQAVTATKKIEGEVKRPEATKSEIALLAEAARAAQIQPHAMTLSCADYERLAPGKGPADPVAMLGLVTRELTRIATSAVAHRDRQPGHRPWIAVYGGALHNDRFPDPGVAEWSYARAVDRASGGHYVELDLIVPEFAEAEPSLRTQPWAPLLPAADRVLVWRRGERSFVVILPRTQPPAPPPPPTAPPAKAPPSTKAPPSQSAPASKSPPPTKAAPSQTALPPKAPPPTKAAPPQPAPPAKARP